MPNVAVINPKLRIRSARHMCGNFVYHRLSEDSVVRIIIYGIYLTPWLRPPHRTYYHFIYCDSLSRCRRRPNVRVINPTSKTQGVHCTYVSFINPETSFRSVWISSHTFTRRASGLQTDRILNSVDTKDLIGFLGLYVPQIKWIETVLNIYCLSKPSLNWRTPRKTPARFTTRWLN